MTRPEEDRQFEQWRRTGETEALARVFDLTAPRLLLVALHVSRNASRADDLVQTTFLEAMRDSSSWDPERPVYRWLTGILSHRALDDHRRQWLRETQPLESSGARPTDGPGAEPDPVQSLLDSELAESVATKVDALPAPYREVLILRLVHGLEPVEIAHSLQRAPSTVRMQLKRGLERLRRELPESLALPALFSVDTGGELASIKAAVLSEATAAATVAAGAGGGLTLSWWSLIAMQTKTTWMIASACLALCAAVWMNWDAGDPTGTESGSVASAHTTLVEPESLAAAPDLQDAPRDSSRALAATPETQPRQPASLEPESVETSLAVRVLVGSAPAPAANIGIHLGRADRADPGTELATDANGVALFDELEPGPFVVTADRGTTQPIEVREGAENELEIVLPAGLTVAGRVVDLEGAPVGGAQIYRHQEGHPNFLQHIATADEAGLFEVENVPDRSDFLARASGYQPSSEESASRPRGGRQQLELVMGAYGHRLEGVVLDPDGEPAGPVLVAIAVDEDARDNLEGVTIEEVEEHKRSSYKPLDRETIFVRADAEGRFTTLEAPAGPAFLMTRGLGRDEAFVATALVNVWPRAENRVTLKLGRAAELSGRVTDENGRSFAGVPVQSTWDGSQEFGSLEDDLGPLHGDRRTLTDETGAYLLTGLLPGEHDLYVGTQRSSLLRDELVVEEGERATWNPVLAPRSELPVRLEGPEGEALAGWGVQAIPPGATGNDTDRTLQSTDEAGRCTLRLISYEPQQLWIHAPDVAARGGASSGAVLLDPLPCHVVEGVLPGADELIVRLRAMELPSAGLIGRLLDPFGEPVERGELRVQRNDVDFNHPVNRRVGGLARDGSFEAPGLAPGTYTVLGLGHRRPTEALGTWRLAEGEVLDVGDLRLSEPATLVVRLEVDDGSELEEPVVFLQAGADGVGAMRSLSRSEDDGPRDEWRRDTLPQGVYQLSVYAKNTAPLFRTIEVLGGGEHFERIVCARGHVRMLDFSLSRAALDALPSGTLRAIEVRVLDAAGKLAWFDREKLETSADASWQLSLRLNEGRYTAHVADHGRRELEPLQVEFEVGPGAPSGPVEVTLP